MERLIESQGACTEAEAELAQLVQACEPVVISEARKRQSLSAVYSRHHERRRTVRLGLRAAMAAGMLLVAGAATAAVFGVRWKIPVRRPAPIAAGACPSGAPRSPRPRRARADHRIGAHGGADGPAGDRAASDPPRPGREVRGSVAGRLGHPGAAPGSRSGACQPAAGCLPANPSPRRARRRGGRALDRSGRRAAQPGGRQVRRALLERVPARPLPLGRRAGSGPAGALSRRHGRLVRRAPSSYDRARAPEASSLDGRGGRCRRRAAGRLRRAAAVTGLRRRPAAARRPRLRHPADRRRQRRRIRAQLRRRQRVRDGRRRRVRLRRRTADAGDVDQLRGRHRHAGLPGPAHRLPERRAAGASRRRPRRLAGLRRPRPGASADHAARRHLASRRLQL